MLPVGAAVTQRSIPFIEAFPAVPVHYAPVDWASRVKRYIERTIQHPDPATNPFVSGAYYQENGEKMTAWAVPAYAVVDPASTPFESRDAEAISTFPTVQDLYFAGLTTTGAYQGVDWLEDSILKFVGIAGGEAAGGGGPIFFNNIGFGTAQLAGAGGSLWYTIWANQNAADIGALSGNAAVQSQVGRAADTLAPLATLFAPLPESSVAAWQASKLYLGTIGFDYGNFAPQYNSAEAGPGPNDYPQTAAGLAYINYFAFLFTSDQSYLTRAKSFYDYYDSLPYGMSPHYEVVQSVAPYLAARLNAEQGAKYDVAKAITSNLLNYPDFADDVRINWGALGSEAGFGAGLVGSTYPESSGAYMFGMNTMTFIGRMLPVAWYAPEFARMVAKYAFNAANASRAFWGDLQPDSNQEGAALAWMAKWDPDRSVGYESARIREGQAYPTSDNPQSRSSPYGAAWVGFLSGILPLNGESGRPLFVARINPTDFMGGSLQRWLLYNPAGKADRGTLPLPAGTFRGWDGVNRALVFDAVSGTATVTVGADAAIVVTCVPQADTLEIVNHQLKDTTLGEVVDYGPF